jgi:hypothetical protein
LRYAIFEEAGAKTEENPASGFFKAEKKKMI